MITKLQYLRAQQPLKLSQRKLGKATGCSGSLIGYFERRERQASLRSAIALAQFFQVPIRDLFQEHDGGLALLMDETI